MRNLVKHNNVISSIRLCVCGLFLMISNVVCAADTAIASGKSPAIYEQSKSAIIINQKQPVFIIKLISNPTTGYNWFLRDYDKSILKPVKHEYYPPQKEQAMPGAPGYELWTFRVKSEAFAVPQRSILKMVYARPWEMEQSTTNAEFVITTISD